jgi:peptide/nickel transport system substrate-binding protein
MAVRSEEISVVTQPTVDYYMLGINTTRPPFDDVRVRQALSLAINREVALNTVLFGEGLVSGPIPPTLGDWAVPTSDLPYFQQDLDQAKELLAEAGYPDGFTFTIVASPFFPEFVSIALVLQDQLKEIGITTEIDQAEWGNFLTMWRERNFDSFVSYQTAGADPDYALYGYFYGGSPFNATQLDDPNVNAYLDEGRTTIDPDQRLDIYRDAQIELAKAAPDLFLFTRTEYIAIRDHVHGFYLRSVDPYTYPAMQTLWIEE